MRDELSYSAVVGEHAFPGTDGVCCGLAGLFVTIGGSGGILTTTTRPELPYPCVSQAKTRDESSRTRK